MFLTMRFYTGTMKCLSGVLISINTNWKKVLKTYVILRGRERGRINNRFKGQHAQGVKKPQPAAVMSAGRLRPGWWARDSLGP